MGTYGWQLAVVAGLILVNALFAGSEIALLSLREGQLRQLEERGGAGRALAQLARDPNRFLATVQVGITLAGFLASATAAVTLAAPLESVLGFLGVAAEPVAVALVTTVLVGCTLVLGELAPKRLAMQRAERWGLLVARPLAGVATLARPVVWLLRQATDLTVRLLGGDPARRRKQVTTDEVRDLVLTPRPDVMAIPGDLSAVEGRDALAAAGHVRAPVYDEELDDAHRIVAVLDLVDGTGTVADRIREVALRLRSRV